MGHYELIIVTINISKIFPKTKDESLIWVDKLYIDDATMTFKKECVSLIAFEIFANYPLWMDH